MVSVEDSVKQQVREAYYIKYGHISRDLCERVLSQINLGTYYPFSQERVNLTSCFTWSRTKEGDFFWEELYQLDYYNELTIESVQKVYEKYEIPFIPNEIIYEVWLT